MLLFTRSLAKVMGYKGQFALYAYYVASAAALRALSPPLALMTAQEAALGGAFRAAHQVGGVWWGWGCYAAPRPSTGAFHALQSPAPHAHTLHTPLNPPPPPPC